nr:hypothetical protein [Tanacetum cinerariifolium]
MLATSSPRSVSNTSSRIWILSISYIGVSTPDQQRHAGTNGQCGVSRPRSPATSCLSRSYIDVSMPDQHCCSGLNGQHGISHQRSLAPGGRFPLFDTLFLDHAAHSGSYTGISTFDQKCHTDADGHRGVSQQRSPATNSRLGNFNRNVNHQRILILANVPIDVITVGLYFDMENGLKVRDIMLGDDNKGESIDCFGEKYTPYAPTKITIAYLLNFSASAYV